MKLEGIDLSGHYGCDSDGEHKNYDACDTADECTNHYRWRLNEDNSTLDFGFLQDNVANSEKCQNDTRSIEAVKKDVYEAGVSGGAVKLGIMIKGEVLLSLRGENFSGMEVACIVDAMLDKLGYLD